MKSNGFEFGECELDKCAWFDETNLTCSMYSIHMDLHDVNYFLNIIINRNK